MKLGTDRHRPLGEWVQATTVFKVAGIAHRKAATLEWVRDIARSLRARLPYGVIIEHELTNHRDRNAIKVSGCADVRGLLGGVIRKTRHVGYVPADIAEDVARDLLAESVPVSAELYYVWWGNSDYIDVNMIILAPPGHSASSRVRRAQT